MEQDKIKETDIPLEIRKELDNKKVSKLSDVLPKQEPVFPDLEVIDTEKTINQEVTIQEIKALPSSYGGEFIVARIFLEGKEHSISYGGKAVVEKLKKIEDKLPVTATLIQKKSVESGRKYYDLE